MLGDDAMHQALVQFRAAIDADLATAGCGDCLHQFCVWRTHLLDFSKAFRNPAQRRMNRWEYAIHAIWTLVAGSIPFRQICSSNVARAFNLFVNSLSKKQALKLL
jgi:hypothetical protein